MNGYFKGVAKVCYTGTKIVGEPVELWNDNNTDVVTWLWTLMGTPPDSPVELSTRTMSRTSFTPDRPGKYIIRLEVNGGRHPAAPWQDFNKTPTPLLGQMSELVYEVRPEHLRDDLRVQYLEYPEDIVSRLLDAHDTAPVSEAPLLREAALTIDNLRNGRGG